MTNWPPPADDLEPSHAHATPDAHDDRRRDATSAATWVAAVGAVLVLAAASVLVVGNWNHIQPQIKLAGLVAANALVAASAAALRRTSRVVSRALAHLAATLVVSSGVAVMAAAHQTWPVAIAVGGAAGVAACLAQARRWRAPLLVPAADAAGVIAAAGAAALGHAPLGVLVAGAAVALVCAKRDASAGRLAALACGTPVLAVLGAFGVGPGTAVRLGARGHALTWAGPVAGIVAGAVLVAIAFRRRMPALAIGGISGACTGVAAALEQLRVTELWVALPAVVIVVLVALTEWVTRRDINDHDRDAWEPAATITRWFTDLAVLAAVASGVVAFAVELSARPQNAALAWSMTAWLAAAIAVATARRPSPVGAIRTPARAGAILAAALVVLSASPTDWPVAAVALASTAAFTAYASAKRDRGSMAVERFCGAVITTMLAAAGLFAHAKGNLLGMPRRLPDASTLATVAIALGVLVLASLTPKARRTHLSDALTIVAAATSWLLTAGALDTSPWAKAAALAAAIAVLVAGGLVHAAAALAPFAGALALHAATASPTVILMAALVAAIGLTGVAMSIERWSAIDTAAIAAAATCALTAAEQHRPGFVSLAIVLAGAQGVLYGTLRRQRELQTVSAVIGGVALVSLPWTSGAVSWIVHRLAPHGVTGTDLAVTVLSIALIAAGMFVRSDRVAGLALTRRPSSWIAYGPGLALAGLHLVSTQVATAQPARVGVAIALGIGAVAAGGLRRLAAPLLGGTALIVTSALLATGHQLASLPVWVWLAVGGVALLAVALLIERRSNGGNEHDANDASEAESTVTTSGESVLRLVWRRFD